MLRRHDLEREVLLVDDDLDVATVRDGRDRGAHALLEEARRRLHRRRLGLLDRGERFLVDREAPGQGDVRLLCDAKLLRERRDLLGIGLVRVHAAEGLVLLGPRTVPRRPRPLDEHLGALASRERVDAELAERGERMAGLLALVGRGVAQGDQLGGVALLDAESAQLALDASQLSGVRLGRGEQRVGLVDRVDPDRGERGLELAAPPPERLLAIAIVVPSVDRGALGHLPRVRPLARLERCADAQPERDERRDPEDRERDEPDDVADELSHGPPDDREDDGEHDPAPGTRWPAGLLGGGDLVADLEVSLQLRHVVAERPDAPDGRAQLCERDRRGRGAQEPRLLVDELDPAAQTLVGVLGAIAALDQRDRALRLGEIGLLARELLVERGALLVRRHPPAAIRLELLERRITFTPCRVKALDLLAHRLDPAGILGSFGPVAADRLIELALGDRSALAGAGDRLLEPVGDLRLVAVERRGARRARRLQSSGRTSRSGSR